MSMSTKVFAHLGHMTKIAATPIYFMKPTPVDNNTGARRLDRPFYFIIIFFFSFSSVL